MTGWELPTEVTVGERRFAVRSDFRAVLDALAALNDPALQEPERLLCFVQILLPDWQTLPDLEQAFRSLMTWINLGKEPPQDQPPKPQLVDWQQDAELIAPAVDQVLGYSCRRCSYLHWWEFIGAYSAIGRGRFAEVVSIRYKKAHGKPLDKAEQAFARENADLVALPGSKLTGEEEEFFRRLGVL